MRKDPRYQQLIDILAKTREKLKISQKIIANRLKKPQSYISKYESGERRIDVLEFINICEALGIKPYTILNRLKKEVTF
jgi:transcriptional regulator with XRE-family HTH domain